MDEERAARIVPVAVGDDGMGGDGHRAGKPRVKAAKERRLDGVVPAVCYLRVGVRELVAKAVPEDRARRAARAAVVLVVVHEARNADVAGEFADGFHLRRVRSSVERHVRPIVGSAERGIPGSPRRGGCACVVAVDVPAFLRAAVVTGAVPLRGLGDRGGRILPEAHDLRAHRGDAAADG